MQTSIEVYSQETAQANEQAYIEEERAVGQTAMAVAVSVEMQRGNMPIDETMEEQWHGSGWGNY